MNRSILVTGGAGYIGSHVALDLLRAGDDVVVVDNLANGHRRALDAVAELAGRAPTFVEADLRDRDAIRSLLDRYPVEATIHLAGLKAVGESVAEPLRYYRVNLDATMTLLEELERVGARRFVFSSSATVYGQPVTVPVPEGAPIRPANPYGRTKAMIEHMLEDLTAADARWQVVALRYFNPVGNDQSGLLGEDPRGEPNNLMPRVMDVATGHTAALTIWGDDYDTPDGTGVRDYLHVSDLAAGHRAALDRLDELPSWFPVNLGTGRGYSVKEVVAEVEQTIGRPLAVETHGRRPGDAAAVVADPTVANEQLGWRTDRGLGAMCTDTWRWREKNPTGYGDT